VTERSKYGEADKPENTLFRKKARNVLIVPKILAFYFSLPL